jgi:hypothetical protein
LERHPEATGVGYVGVRGGSNTWLDDGLGIRDREVDMTKEQMLQIIKLLAALESWGFAEKNSLPEYLHDQIDESIKALTKELLR